MKTLRVYSKPNCGYCAQAKSFLSTNDIPYEEINIESEPGAREWLVEKGQRTLPVFTINGEIAFHGGWSTLKTVRKEELTEMLK